MCSIYTTFYVLFIYYDTMSTLDSLSLWFPAGFRLITLLDGSSDASVTVTSRLLNTLSALREFSRQSMTTRLDLTSFGIGLNDLLSSSRSPLDDDILLS